MTLVEVIGAREGSRTLSWTLHLNTGLLKANLHGLLVLSLYFQRRGLHSPVAPFVTFPSTHSCLPSSILKLMCLHLLPRPLFLKLIWYHLEYLIKIQILGCSLCTTKSETRGFGLGIHMFTAYWVFFMQKQLLANL